MDDHELHKYVYITASHVEKSVYNILVAGKVHIFREKMYIYTGSDPEPLRY